MEPIERSTGTGTDYCSLAVRPLFLGEFTFLLQESCSGSVFRIQYGSGSRWPSNLEDDLVVEL